MNDVTRYADMKDSGVEWIGKIPSHIPMSRLGLHCNIILGKMLCTSQLSKNYSLESYYCAANVHFGKIDDTNLKQMWFSSDEKKKYAVRTGDLLVVEGGAGAGGCAIVHEGTKKVFIQNSIMIVRSYYGDNRYISYLIESLVRRGYVDFVCNKATIQHFTKDKIENIPYPVFSVKECHTISDFLDDMCSKINSIIDSIRTSIEEYKKWKASVIYEAVTKGLDPHAEMKDSGVAWIGKIPSHINVSRVGLHYEIVLGKMLCSDKFSESCTFESYYCAANVHFGKIDSSNLKKMWFSYEEKEKYLVHKGDALVVEGGAGAGGCAVVEDDVENTYIQNSIMIVRSKTRNCKYIRYIIENLYNLGYIDFICNKATIPHFTKEKLAKVPLPLFSPEECNAIVDYLDTKCSEIEQLISEKEVLISDLESYKKSLIYEVVTGKRKII